MIGLLKGAKTSPRTYLTTDSLAIFEKYSGAKEAELRAATSMA